MRRNGRSSPPFAPILMSFSFRRVSDQSLIGSGVAMLPQELPRLSRPAHEAGPHTAMTGTSGTTALHLIAPSIVRICRTCYRRQQRETAPVGLTLALICVCGATIEGQAGFDTLDFNGANAAENIDISANGGSATFFRGVANVMMDLDDVETISFDALGGSNDVVINDMSGTDVTKVEVDLAATLRRLSRR